MVSHLVQLYCYDLSGGMAESMSVALIGRHLDAIWHTAVVVYGKEYFFDGGVGVVHTAPGGSHFGTPKRIEALGTTTRTETEFADWISQQGSDTFGPTHYNLLDRNCNHFTQAAARFLVERDIPEDIRNMIPTVLDTPLGRMLKPMLEVATGGAGSASQGAQPSVAGTNMLIPSTKTQLDGLQAVVRTSTGLISQRSQLTVEEHEQLMLACAMLQSNELFSSGAQEGLNATVDALTFLRTVILNILMNPTQLSCRTLSTRSKEYKTKIGPLEQYGATDILRICGFRLVQHPSSEQSVWFLSDSDGSEDILVIMVTHLNDLIDSLTNEAQSKGLVVEVEAHTTAAEGKAQPTTFTMPKDVSPGDKAMKVIMHDAVQPILSLEDLMDWSPTSPGVVTPAEPCRPRVRVEAKDKPKLLLCHDMKGGYLVTDYQRFAVCNRLLGEAPSLIPSVVNQGYTVSFWHLVDYFVYFSHNLVAVPPKEWINYAHRGGVPALGTFMVEGKESCLNEILHDAQSAAATIKKLVDLCDVYNFDGYFVNIEVDLDKTLSKRLLTFVSTLKKSLNRSRSQDSQERFVFWYDAITVDGVVSYQNGLTSQNKPFFDVCDGLFINYGWRPYNLPLSTVLAGERNSDVFTGIDAFGRGVYGGGGFDCDKAARCASGAKLSVGLFAPGWTLERSTDGGREGFLRRDAHMWSKMQDVYTTKHLELFTLPVWTCFLSEFGTQFFINGTRTLSCSCTLDNHVAGGTYRDDDSRFFAEWCQYSQAHMNPCYRLVRADAEGDPWCALPFEVVCGDSRVGDQEERMVPLEWTTRHVWMGNRSLCFAIPPSAVVPLMRWKVHLEGEEVERKTVESAVAFVDIAWRRSVPDAGTRPIRCICVEGGDGSVTKRVLFDEQLASQDRIIIVANVGEWEIIRYVIPDSVEWKYITCVSVLNPSESYSLACTVGGVAITGPSYTDASSVLLLGDARTLPSTSYTVEKTSDPSTFVVTLDVPDNLRESAERMILFAKIGCAQHNFVTAYLGTHSMSTQLLLPLRAPVDAVVYEMFFYVSASGI